MANSFGGSKVDIALSSYKSPHTSRLMFHVDYENKLHQAHQLPRLQIVVSTAESVSKTIVFYGHSIAHLDC